MFQPFSKIFNLVENQLRWKKFLNIGYRKLIEKVAKAAFQVSLFFIFIFLAKGLFWHSFLRKTYSKGYLKGYLKCYDQSHKNLYHKEYILYQPIFCQIIPYQSTLKLINVSNLQAMYQKAQVASSIGI